MVRYAAQNLHLFPKFGAAPLAPSGVDYRRSHPLRLLGAVVLRACSDDPPAIHLTHRSVPMDEPNRLGDHPDVVDWFSVLRF